MLHFKPFGKSFNTEFIKSPLLETVKIKILISLVITSGNIDFDFTEKSQYFIGKHIRIWFNLTSSLSYLFLTPFRFFSAIWDRCSICSWPSYKQQRILPGRNVACFVHHNHKAS